jgi:hypothetical protein
VYPIQSETAEEVADRVLTAVAFDLPTGYNSTYPEKVQAVTSAQVKEMAQRYLSAGDLDIVLAGNVSEFRDALKKAFPDANYEEIPFEQVDVLAPDLRKPKETAAAITPESLEQGKEILLAAAKAAGGDLITSVSTLKMVENGKLHGPNGDTAVVVNWQVAYPYHSHGNVMLGENKVVQVCDGNSAWVEYGGQTRDVTRVIGEFERGIALFGGGWGLYQQALEGRIEAQSIGEEEVEGKKMPGVSVDGPFGPIKLYFDPESHLLAAARYESRGGSEMVSNEQCWSDYRPVEGRQFAFTTVIYRGGEKFSESTVQDVTINPKLEESVFSKPEAATAK